MAVRKKLGKSHERLRQETQDLVLKSARDLFAEHGYAQTTMQMIAERAGVSRSSLYRHFDDKWQVAKPVMEMIWPDWERVFFQNFPSGKKATMTALARWLREILAILRTSQTHVYAMREIEALEPEASFVILSMNKRMLEHIANSSKGGFPITDDITSDAHAFDQIALMQLEFFFYTSLRTSWDIDNDAPIRAMARHLKHFLNSRSA